MHNKIGDRISIILKDKEQTIIPGVLKDISNDFICVVSDGCEYYIPEQNVNYGFCSVGAKNTKSDNSVVEEDKTTNADSNRLIVHASSQAVIKEDKTTNADPNEYILSVYVNENLIEKIPVPPTFNLNSFHNDIYKTALGNPTVASYLQGRKQKTASYCPGELYIEVYVDNDEPVIDNTEVPNTFSMDVADSSSDFTNAFLTPKQIVNRVPTSIENIKKNLKKSGK